MTMKRTTTNRTTRISIRKTDGGYRITGDTRTFRSHSTAFNAAWRAAANAVLWLRKVRASPVMR